MTLLTCAAVRRRLPAFHDGELPVHDQIAVEAHVNGCVPCGGELTALRAVGDALRLASAPAPAEDWIGLQPGVISRMRAEAHESWSARTGRMFDDLHLIWVGLAATVGTIVCGIIAMSVLQFAAPERGDSLAAMIAEVSAPLGSDENPVRSYRFLQVPSVPERGPIEIMLAQPVTHEELMLALSAVVTRDGRVAGVSVLSDGRSARDIDAILAVLARARLEPGRRGQSPVAVNLVWLLAHTTVKAKAPGAT